MTHLWHDSDESNETFKNSYSNHQSINHLNRLTKLTGKITGWSLGGSDKNLLNSLQQARGKLHCSIRFICRKCWKYAAEILDSFPLWWRNIDIVHGKSWWFICCQESSFVFLDNPKVSFFKKIMSSESETLLIKVYSGLLAEETSSGAPSMIHMTEKSR